jgi:hypothetical protein
MKVSFFKTFMILFLIGTISIYTQQSSNYASMKTVELAGRTSCSFVGG